MKTLLFDAMTHIDPAYVESASKAMEEGNLAKSRRPLRYLLIAATLTLILAAILLPIALGKDRTTIPEITTSTPTTTEKIYASLLEIPQAQEFDSNLVYGAMGKPFIPYEMMVHFDNKKWIENIITNNNVIIGQLIDASAVILQEETLSYIVYSLMVTVEENVCNANESGTVTLVTVCPFNPNENTLFRHRGTYSPHEGVSVPLDAGQQAMSVAREGISLVFLLDAPEKHELTVNGVSIDLSLYGKYYLNGSLATFDHQAGSMVGTIIGLRTTLWINDLREEPKDFNYKVPDTHVPDYQDWPIIGMPKY